MAWRSIGPESGSKLDCASYAMESFDTRATVFDRITALVATQGNSAAPRTYLMLFIQSRIGPVTLVSAVSGDMTSEMWL
jgi:hypothetical protein